MAEVQEQPIPSVEEVPASEQVDDSAESKSQQNPKSKSRYHQKKVISDPMTLGVTDDPAEIRKQVEFYFSDSNLMNDKFLFEKVGGSENKSVKIKLLASFKRMQRFQPYEAIVAALKESTELEVTEDEEVRRKVPLSEQIKDIEHGKEQWLDATLSRSIYAKGFGEEKPETQYEIEKFFQPYGPVKSVRLRRFPDRKFKGSVFVEFQDDETQQKFMDVDPKPKWNDKDLLWMTKEGYVLMKAADIKSGKVQKTPSYSRGGRGGRGGGRGRGDRGRGGRDFGRRDRRNGDNKNVPKVSQSDPSADNQAGANDGAPQTAPKPESTTATEEQPNGASNKRQRDEDGAGAKEEPEAKKTHVEA